MEGDILRNTYGISEISFTKEVTAYCPIGQDYYRAEITVSLEPNEYLMDYCKADKFIQGLYNKPVIIEALIEEVFKYFKGYAEEGSLEVEVYAESDTHFPVTVIKRG